MHDGSTPNPILENVYVVFRNLLLTAKNFFLIENDPLFGLFFSDFEKMIIIGNID